MTTTKLIEELDRIIREEKREEFAIIKEFYTQEQIEIIRWATRFAGYTLDSENYMVLRFKKI